MSKNKINPNASSKLAKLVVQKQQIEDDNIKFIEKDKRKSVLKTYRFNTIDLDHLNKIILKINKESTYKLYTESDVIRGLLYYADSTINISKFLKAIQKRGV